MKTNLRFLWLAAGGITLLPVTVFAQSSSSSAAYAPETQLQKDYRAIGARYKQSRWTYPTSEQMAEAYPRAAQDSRIQGAAQIACFIDTDGYMKRCVVVAEEPQGYGFGRVTADLFMKYAHVDPVSVEGGIQPGDFHMFVYKWQIG